MLPQTSPAIESRAIVTCCLQHALHVMQSDVDAFNAASRSARRIAGEPHRFFWDVVAALPLMQEDVLAHLAEPHCSYLSGEFESWDKLTHSQRVARVKRDVRAIRSKRFHKQWQGERTLDRLFFLVRQAGGSATVSSLSASLKLGEAAVRKAVRERSRGKLFLDGSGNVLYRIYQSIEPNMDVTMHTASSLPLGLRQAASVKPGA